jgi:hypothetical protein
LPRFNFMPLKGFIVSGIAVMEEFKVALLPLLVLPPAPVALLFEVADWETNFLYYFNGKIRTNWITLKKNGLPLINVNLYPK